MSNPKKKKSEPKPQNKKNNLLACYKCGSKPVSSNNGNDHETTYFSCGNYTQCDVVGPTCDSFTEAVIQWNELMRMHIQNTTPLARYAAVIRAITLLRDGTAPSSASEELANTIVTEINRLRAEVDAKNTNDELDALKAELSQANEVTQIYKRSASSLNNHLKSAEFQIEKLKNEQALQSPESVLTTLGKIIGSEFRIASLSNGRVLVDIWNKSNICVMISGAGNYWRIECHYFTPQRRTEGVMSLTEAVAVAKLWISEKTA